MGLNHLMICTYSADDLRPLMAGSVRSGWEGLLVKYFLMKSTCRVSAPSAMLASVLSKAGWSLLMT